MTTPNYAMHKVTGACHCGNISVDLNLTSSPNTYSPRVCDCDFCRKYAAAYVSDAHGSLVIIIKDQRDSSSYRQGNGLAEFLICQRCGVLVAVLYRNEEQLYATVNATTTGIRMNFGSEQLISPKKLSGTEKMQRWREMWFSKVDLVQG